MNKLNIFLASAGMAIAAAACTAPSSEKAAVPADSTASAIENIMTRTSVRKFTAQPVGADTLEAIVKAGMAAPTAMNRQPWAFVVVTEREMLDSLDAVHPSANLKTATAAIIVCGDVEKGTMPDGGRYWIQDCSAASENILLAANAYGLGSVWCAVFPNNERIPGVCRVLGIPGGIMPLNVIALGHPAAEPQPKDKWDPAKVHYQHW